MKHTLTWTSSRYSARNIYKLHRCNKGAYITEYKRAGPLPCSEGGRMDLQETYIFFGQVRLHENKIKRLTNTINELKSCLYPGGIRYDLDKVNTSPKDKMSEIYARIDELEREIEQEYEFKAQAVLKIDNTLKTIPEGDGKTILAEYYIARKSMPKIASEMGYSMRHCFRLRSQTIKQLVEVENE